MLDKPNQMVAFDEDHYLAGRQEIVVRLRRQKCMQISVSDVKDMVIGRKHVLRRIDLWLDT